MRCMRQVVYGLFIVLSTWLIVRGLCCGAIAMKVLCTYLEWVCIGVSAECAPGVIPGLRTQVRVSAWVCVGYEETGCPLTYPHRLHIPVPDTPFPARTTHKQETQNNIDFKLQFNVITCYEKLHAVLSLIWKVVLNFHTYFHTKST